MELQTRARLSDSPGMTEMFFFSFLSTIQLFISVIFHFD